jgi:hypothetical protein
MRSQSPSIGSVAGFAVALVFGAAGCDDGKVNSTSGCVVDDSLQCQSDFIGYSCPGSVRPDDNPDFGQSVQGIVCTDEGQLEVNSHEDYCCTAGETTCAHDTGAGCVLPNVGYSCMGADRPEAFDSTLFCGTGLRQNGLINYCCGAMSAQVCSANSTVVCPEGTNGWSCTGPQIPGEADLGVDQSRADSPLVCSVAANPAPGQSTYCCYTPSEVPTGGSCLSDESVTGCAAGAFAFACTGPDSPDQDYPRVTCTTPPVRGLNAQGIAAELYCCTFDQTP